MLYMFSAYLVLFTIFILFLICFVPFEGEQEQVYEEENQQFDEEGKWTSASTCSILIPTIAWWNNLLYCYMHKIDGNPIKDFT